MTAEPANTQTDATRRAFDDWSGHWREHYKDDGLMAGRVARFMAALSVPPAEGGKVLDFGCGTGEIAAAASSGGWQVDGCDISSRMIAACEARPDGAGVVWHALAPSTPLPLPFEDAAFDAVVSSSVFEYLAAPDAVLAEVARVLKPEGRLLFTVPDPRHDVRRREARLARLARIAPIWWIVSVTRWREMFRYLRISVNRPALAVWREMLHANGFDAAVPSDADDPLALLIGTKRE